MQMGKDQFPTIWQSLPSNLKIVTQTYMILCITDCVPAADIRHLAEFEGGSFIQRKTTHVIGFDNKTNLK